MFESQTVQYLPIIVDHVHLLIKKKLSETPSDNGKSRR